MHLRDLPKGMQPESQKDLGFETRLFWFLTQSPSLRCMHCSAKIDASKKASGRWLNM